MRKEEFMFDSRDGKTRLHAFRWIPDGEIKCILQIIHGMAEYTNRYEALAEYMAQRGILVTGEDLLGHGRSVPEDGTFGYFCEKDAATVVVRDVHRLKKITQEAYPGIPYIILGHSMGSFILRDYLFRYGTGISGAIISGTGSQPAPVIKFSLLLTNMQRLLFGQKHVSKLIDYLAFKDYNKRIENKRTSFDWLCTQNDVVDAYVKDPWCGFTFTVNGFRTMFTLLNRLNKTESLKTMPGKLPIVFISGELDPVGNYGTDVKNVYESFLLNGMEKVSLKLYSNCRHEILNEAIKYDIYEELFSWIMERVEEY